MSEKNQLFAFVAGEVAPEFYGRRDLAKFPLALAKCENFLVDFRGGLVNRPGTQFIAMLPRQMHKWATFSTLDYDIALLFLHQKMYVLYDGQFVQQNTWISGVANAQGRVAESNSFAEGDLVYVAVGGRSGVYSAVNVDGGGFNLVNAAGNPLVGPLTVYPLYYLTTPYSGPTLSKLRFFQEGADLIITSPAHQPGVVTYVSDENWTYATISSNIPEAPEDLTASVQASSGDYETSYTVTAVVGGVESPAAAPVKVSSMDLPDETPTQYVSLTWTAVPGATEYFLYRSLVYREPGMPTAPELGYLGRTTGTDFTDYNIDPDFTKVPPHHVNYWSGNNYPSVYGRFQQRGYFAGFTKDPLGIVASVPNHRDLYIVNNPVMSSDAFRYELDSQTGKPIHSILPLRYGLMIFDAQGITQLKGSGQSVAVTATDAFAEVQGYTSVAPVQPIAINLDVLYTTEGFTEVNAMAYTEYTNSFKSQDILILSSHLFGERRPITQMTWCPEPHKVVAFGRGDGQLVKLTYEDSQDIYAWSRHRTRGRYMGHTMLRENGHCVLYHTIYRVLLGENVMTVERDMPRRSGGYDRHWYVDCGAEYPISRPQVTARAVKVGEGDLADWVLYISGSTPPSISPGNIVYLGDAMFRVDRIDPSGTRYLRPMVTEATQPIYDQNSILANPGDWGYGTPTNSFDGLWWLEGEEVSVQADGDYWLDRKVTNGKVTFDGEGARILAGLPYESFAQTLPLSLSDMLLDGRPLAIRGIALRQWQSRGLAIGTSYTAVEELPSRRYEPWGNPLDRDDNLTIVPWLGRGSWGVEQHLTFLQRYPAPTSILGLVFNLDVGDD